MKLIQNLQINSKRVFTKNIVVIINDKNNSDVN